MHWLFLLLAIAALGVAINASSVAVIVVCLLVALAFILAFVFRLAADRVGSRARDEHLILDPEELRRLREQAEARKVAASQGEQR